MKEYIKVLYMGALPVIIGSAILDTLLIAHGNIIEYIIVCAWEYFIFSLGFIGGLKVVKRHLVIRNEKKEIM